MFNDIRKKSGQFNEAKFWKLLTITGWIQLLATIILPGKVVDEIYPKVISFGFPNRFLTFYETPIESAWFVNLASMNLSDFGANCFITFFVLYFIFNIKSLIAKKRDDA